MSVTVSARGRQVVREAVAAAVKRIVRSRSETPAALAERFGVTKFTVDRWANGDGYPNYTTAVRLAPLVGIDPATGKAVA